MVLAVNSNNKSAIKFEKSNPQNRNLQKISPKTSNVQLKQAQKQATGKSSKKTASQQKKKPKFAGKPQGWQNCRRHNPIQQDKKCFKMKNSIQKQWIHIRRIRHCTGIRRI